MDLDSSVSVTKMANTIAPSFNTLAVPVLNSIACINTYQINLKILSAQLIC